MGDAGRGGEHPRRDEGKARMCGVGQVARGGAARVWVSLIFCKKLLTNAKFIV
jgi:hypothetical protein